MRKMNWTTIILLFGVINSSVQLWQPGREWTYSYHALLRAGALLPAEAHSQWDLQGQLTVRSIDPHTIAVRLSSLTSSTYNGLRDSLPASLNPTPLPVVASRALETSFLVHYATDEGGTVAQALSVSINDPLWAVNVKRSIASVLQLRQDRLSEPATIVSEHGLHGLCRHVEYSVVNNTEYVYLRKTIDGARCELSPLSWSSAPLMNCPGAEEHSYAATTTREYTLAHKENGRFELQHVMSSRRLYVQPFRASAEAHHVYQYQVYRLLSSTESLSMNSSSEEPTLIKRSLMFEHDSRDLTQGRAPAIQPDVLHKVLNLLDRLVSTLDDSFERSRGAVHSRLLTQLYYTCNMLVLDSLKQLYDEIAIGTSYQLETKRNMFLELLPQIGTTASAHFIRDLVLQRRIKDLASIKLLAVFPFYARHSDETLLRDMEPLLHLGDNYDSTIRQAAALCFATLVQRTYAAGRCTSETLESYAHKYLDLFAGASTYSQRIVYLQALDNLQSTTTFEFLSSIISNGEQSRHLRFLAVWAAMSLAPEYPSETFRLFWPLLVDRSQPLEMRVAALTILLIAEPTEARLLTLYWYIQAEPDQHLTNFFYSTLVSLHRTTYPCYVHLGRLARHVSRFMRRPSPAVWTTGNYLLDYRDTESAFGGMTQLFLVGNPISGAPDVFYLTFNSYATGRNFNQVSVYLKLHGLIEHLSEGSVDSLQRLVKMLQSTGVKLPPQPNLHIELIVKVQGKSVFCQYFDRDNFNKLLNALKHLDIFLAYHMNYQSIFLPYLSELAEPSDVGTLVLRGIVSNSVASARGNSTSERPATSAYNLDLDLRYYTYTTSFLEVYNPAANIWHGVQKSRSLQARVLFNGTVQPTAKFGVRLQAGYRPEYLNAALHSNTQTYLLGNSEAVIKLRSHCPQCNMEYVVRAEPVSPHASQTLVNLELPLFSTALRADLFDCEGGQNHARLFADVFATHEGNVDILPLAASHLYLLHLLDYITYVLPHRSCGIALKLTPLHQEATQVVFDTALRQSTNIATDVESEASTVSELTLQYQKLLNGTALELWNISLGMKPSSDWKRVSVNLTLWHQQPSGDEQNLCFDLDIATSPGAVRLWMEDETLLHTKASFSSGNSTENSGIVLEGTVKREANDESRHLWRLSNSWPYAQCRQDVIKTNSTPFSMPCYMTALETVANGRYTVQLNITHVPSWVTTIVSQLTSLTGMIPDGNLSELKSGTLNVSVSTSRQRLIFLVNNARKEIESPAVESLTWPVLPDRVCVMSAHELWTIDNRTVPLDEMRKKDVLLVAECTRTPRFALFLESVATSVHELAFTLYTAVDTVTVRPSPAAVLVTVNDMPLGDATRTNDGTAVRRLPGGALHVDTHGLAIHYTRTHMLVRYRSLLPARLCGLCSKH